MVFRYISMSCLRFLLIFAFLPAVAQVNPTTLAMERMEKKGKWTRVEQGIRKSLSKNSVDPESRYTMSLYYLSNMNPSGNIDSAYAYSNQRGVICNLCH
ncbi:MAG: hypothetical protein WDN75_14370 [Bacteroidota bacterium]